MELRQLRLLVYAFGGFVIGSFFLILSLFFLPTYLGNTLDVLYRCVGHLIAALLCLWAYSRLKAKDTLVGYLSLIFALVNVVIIGARIYDLI